MGQNLDMLWDLDKFWHALGLRQIFEINLINTAGLRGMKFGEFGQFYNYSGCKRNEMWGEIVRPAVGLRQILSIISGN